MKKIISSIVWLIISIIGIQYTYSQDFNALTFNSYDGKAHRCNEFSGKKVVFIILPSVLLSSENIYLKHIDSLSKIYSTVQFIAVPSKDDGYTNSTSETLYKWYRSFLSQSIIISEAQFTLNTSTSQGSLFYWLTHATGNGHIDVNDSGPGQQYFIDANGTLTGIFPPEARTSSKVYKLMKM